MPEPLERGERLGDGGPARAQRAGDGDGGAGVGEVVGAGDLERAHRVGAAVHPVDDLAAADGDVGVLPVAGEGDDARAPSRRLPGAHRIARRDDGDVLGRHSHEGVALGVGVLGEARVTIEVIVGDVEQRVRAGVERRHALGLEARDLEDEHVPRPIDDLGERDAEVAADEGAPPVPGHRFADERRGGALAVGAADEGDRRGHEARGELELADHLAAAALEGLARRE